MSSIVLDAAEAALSAKTGLSDIDSTPAGNLNGKETTHWSYKLFIAGSVVGAIAAIAGLILGLAGVLGVTGYIIAVGGLFFSVTNGFAAFYVKRFGVLTTLEDYTKALSERLKLLSSKTLQISKENEQLKKINLGLNEIPKDWKAEIEKGKKKLDAKTKELEEIAGKLEATEKKLEMFEKLTAVLGKQTEEMTKDTLEFSKDSAKVVEENDKLKGNVDALDKENEELLSHIKELDAQNDQTAEILKSFSKNNQEIQGMYKLMRSLYLEAKEKMEGLKKEVDSLKTVVPQAVESTEKIDQVTKKYEHMINALELKLEKYKEYKVGYDLWQKFVTGPEYPLYLAWRTQTK